MCAGILDDKVLRILAGPANAARIAVASESSAMSEAIGSEACSPVSCAAGAVAGAGSFLSASRS